MIVQLSPWINFTKYCSGFYYTSQPKQMMNVLTEFPMLTFVGSKFDSFHVKEQFPFYLQYGNGQNSFPLKLHV